MGAKVVKVSAPGKLILFGEHAVVYKRPALATAIDKRLVVEVQRSKKPGFHVSVAGIPTFGLKIDYEEKRVEATKDYSLTRKAVEYFTEGINYLKKEYDIELSKRGVDATIKSGIPLAVGFGSSAAVCVATTKAVTELFDINLDKDQIRKIAFHLEKTVQVSASPTDTSISTYGGYVMVERGVAVPLEVNIKPPIKVIVAWLPLVVDEAVNNYSRLKTKRLVDAVRLRRNKFPEILKNIFDTIERVTMEAKRALLGRDLPTIGGLMNINHGLLESIGVVTSRLSNIVKVSQDLGALGAKLTGAGSSEEIGGAGAIWILPPEDDKVVLEISAGIRALGGNFMKTSIGAPGIEVSYH